MANAIGIVGLVVGIFAFIFSLLALALPYWSTADDAGVEFYFGLWKYCAEASGIKKCDDSIDFVTGSELSKFKAIRAMVVLGSICTLIALILFVLFLFVLKDKKILGFIAGGVSIAAGLFLMVAMAIYVDEFEDEESDLSGAFALDILAWIAAWIAGALMFVGVMKSGEAV